MAVDYASLGMALAAVITAAGAVLTGVLTGRSARTRDRSDAALKADQLKLEREKTEDEIVRKRMSDYQTEITSVRQQLREAGNQLQIGEDRHFERVRDLQNACQKNWEYAQYHFGLVGTIAHLWNNVLHIIESPHTNDRLIAECAKTQGLRFKSLGQLPTAIEDIPTRRNTVLREK